MSRSISCIIAVLFSLIGTCAYAVDLAAVQDTFVESSAARAQVNLGSSGTLGVSSSRVALIRFDSKALAGATGDIARLNLRVVAVKKQFNPIAIHIVRGPWQESTVTARTVVPIATLALDEKVLTPADLGKIVSFDISGALVLWRSDPKQNFGIAISAGSPSPNLSFGTRESRQAATLSVTAGPPDAEARLWSHTSNSVDLITATGRSLAHVTTAFGRPLQFLASIAADESNGGVWVPVFHQNRLVRLGPAGEPQLEIAAPEAGALAVDSTNGSVWAVVTNGATRELAKFSRSGALLARIHGVPGAGLIALDDVHRSFWVLDGLALVRITGTDGQLNGYDASGAVGLRHRRVDTIPRYIRALDVNPNNDGEGTGNAWLSLMADNLFLGEIAKYSTAGLKLFQVQPPGRLSNNVQELKTDRVGGGAWVNVSGPLNAVAHLTSDGALDRLVTVSVGVRDVSTLPYYEIPTDVAFDPYRQILWTNVLEIRQYGNLEQFTRAFAALDAHGHEVSRFLVAEGLNPALQLIRARITIAKGKPIDPRLATVIPVELLSKSTFDALQVDASSARFGPARARPTASRAVDVNGDGFTDLVFDFKSNELGLTCDTRVGGLTAATFGGIPIAADSGLAVAAAACGQ